MASVSLERLTALWANVVGSDASDGAVVCDTLSQSSGRSIKLDTKVLVP